MVNTVPTNSYQETIVTLCRAKALSHDDVPHSTLQPPVFCPQLIKHLTWVPSGAAGVPGDAGEKARLLMGGLGTNEGRSRPDVDLEDVEVSEGDRFSCVWGRT